NRPPAGESTEYGVCGITAHARSSVLPQDEELRHVVGITRADESESRPLPIGSDQVRMTVGLRPVVVEIPVAELTVLIDIGAIELREVVAIELEQMAQHTAICLASFDDLDRHGRQVALPGDQPGSAPT